MGSLIPSQVTPVRSGTETVEDDSVDSTDHNVTRSADAASSFHTGNTHASSIHNIPSGTSDDEFLAYLEGMKCAMLDDIQGLGITLSHGIRQFLEDAISIKEDQLVLLQEFGISTMEVFLARFSVDDPKVIVEQFMTESRMHRLFLSKLWTLARFLDGAPDFPRTQDGRHDTRDFLTNGWHKKWKDHWVLHLPTVLPAWNGAVKRFELESRDMFKYGVIQDETTFLTTPQLQRHSHRKKDAYHRSTTKSHRSRSAATASTTQQRQHRSVYTPAAQVLATAKDMYTELDRQQPLFDRAKKGIPPSTPRHESILPICANGWAFPQLLRR